MSLSLFWAMATFALAGAISPGPVNVLATAVGARAGFVRALPHVTGASVCYVLIVWLSGTGLQQLWRGWPWLGGALPYAGAGYLLYLAARIALAPVRAEDDDSAEAQSGLWRGALCQGLNPKAWWVAMSGVSVLVGVGEGQALRLMWFCALSGVICWLSVATWAGLGRVLRPWLAQPARQRVFNWLMAAALLAAVGPLLLPV